MPTPLKGTVRLHHEQWIARITYDRGRRLQIPLTTCRPIPADREKAEERARLLSHLSQQLRLARLTELAPQLLERAATRDGQALDDVVTAVGRLVSGEASPPISAATTVQELGEQWTSGELHERWPDHVKKKRSARDDEERLRLYVYPLVGSVPLPEFSAAHADLVMASLPAKLSPATRRHVAQVLSRVLKLAAYPCRLITATPLPAGFLPNVGKRKALSFLYPDEDRRLLSCDAVPLAYRVLYGVLAREGMRRGEAASISWAELDLERGAVAIDRNKTDDARAWALDQGVTRALRAWWELRGRPAEGLVFIDGAGQPLADKGDGKGCTRFRAHLRAAGVDRAELFERSDARQPIRLHDLRATFITVSLANGRTETWVSDRTGHTSSVMINRYRRAARRVSELGLGDLLPLDQAIPELGQNPSAEPDPEPSGGPDDRGRDRPDEGSDPSPSVATDAENATGSDGIAEAGLEPACPCGQRILNPRPRALIGADPAFAGVFGGLDATDRDALIRINALSALIAGESPRAALVRLLGVFAGHLAAAGDVDAARVAHEALGRLLASPRAAGEGADVVGIESARRSRGKGGDDA